MAIKIDTIEKPDNLHALEVLEQAKKNVTPYSTVYSLVLDRGFLDGKILYDIDLQGIELAIPLKRNMAAAEDARQLALASYTLQCEIITSGSRLSALPVLPLRHQGVHFFFNPAFQTRFQIESWREQGVLVGDHAT